MDRWMPGWMDMQTEVKQNTLLFLSTWDCNKTVFETFFLRGGIVTFPYPFYQLITSLKIRKFNIIFKSFIKSTQLSLILNYTLVKVVKKCSPTKAYLSYVLK